MSTNVDNIAHQNLIESQSNVCDYWLKSAEILALILIVSGVAHFVFGFITHASWDGPVSPRKPGLFGISAGSTAWSLLWTARALRNSSFALTISSMISCALFAEVTLITIQYWRGVPSHFNRSSAINTAIETTMVGLIMLVTTGIAWICWLAQKSIFVDVGKQLAIRAGLWFLFLSCMLGFVVMFAGELNLARGRSAEIWNRAGVLKYPHGAVLHALQSLPILNWLMTSCRIKRRVMLLQLAIVAHFSFLIHALWQTWNGYLRLDLDLVGGATLIVSTLLLLVPLIAIAVVACHDAVHRSRPVR